MTTHTTSDAIRIADLRKEYGPVAALDGVSLDLGPGGVHCFAGPNGSGKTTLLRTVAGLVTPTGGEVSTPPDATLGYAFQRPNLYPDLTVSENLDVFGRLARARPEWRETLVDRLGLSPVLHRPADALSGGFAKKTDLALALLKEPGILLLDEPLGDIDDATRRQLLDVIASYAGPDRIVAASTHHLDAFADLAERLTVLVDGEIVLDEPTADMTATPHEAYVATLDDEW